MQKVGRPASFQHFPKNANSVCEDDMSHALVHVGRETDADMH